MKLNNVIVFIILISDLGYLPIKSKTNNFNTYLQNTNNTKLAFLLKDVFGSESLKYDCMGVWDPDYYDEFSYLAIDRCKKARIEIEKAKMEYPILLNFVNNYKSKTPLGVLKKDLATLKRIEYFQSQCNNGIAEKTSKTMRFWGTQEVGGILAKEWFLEDLWKMGASDYQKVLDACSVDSWLTNIKKKYHKIINDLFNLTYTSIENISSTPIYLPIEYKNDLQAFLINVKENRLIQKYQDDIIKLEANKQTIKDLIDNWDWLNNKIESINILQLRNLIKEIDKKISTSQQSLRTIKEIERRERNKPLMI